MADVALMVEASGSTLRQDRDKKRTAYAKSGVPVYWIVNLVDRQVEVYSRPEKTGYKSRKNSPGPANSGYDRLPRTPSDRRR